MSWCSKILLFFMLSISVAPSFAAENLQIIKENKYADAAVFLKMLPKDETIGNCKISYMPHSSFYQGFDFYFQTAERSKTYLFSLGFNEIEHSLKYRPSTPAFNEDIGILFDHKPESSFSNKAQFYMNNKTGEIIGLKINIEDFKASPRWYDSKFVIPFFSTFNCGNVGGSTSSESQK